MVRRAWIIMICSLGVKIWRAGSLTGAAWPASATLDVAAILMRATVFDRTGQPGV